MAVLSGSVVDAPASINNLPPDQFADNTAVVPWPGPTTPTTPIGPTTGQIWPRGNP